MTTINVDYEDLREGDRVTLTIGGDSSTAQITGTLNGDSHSWGIKELPGYCWPSPLGESFVSATREVPDLPSEPGAYADMDGDVWLLAADGEWFDGAGDMAHKDDVAPFTPFTPLRLESEVRAEVEAEIAEWLRKETELPFLAERIARGEYR